MGYEEIVPKVFISYSWSSETHKQWVLELAEKLVAKSGVDVILDRWHGVVGHDRFQFMEESIKVADKVLVICDKTYCEKANGRHGGVGTETLIITPDVYKDTKQEKFIPISLEEENGEYLLPDFFKSRFALSMKLGDLDKSYKELERLIWEEPLLTPPPRGKKPDFKEEKKEDDTLVPEEPIFNDSDEERVIWLLPRGFLLYTDITFESHDSWAVVVSYYDYEGEWRHSTHYHESYSRSWDRNLEIQYKKLSIPEADWNWARAPLNFLMELREVTEKVDIQKRVENEQKYDYPVYYFNRSEPIYLPKVPPIYKFFHDTGNLREILEDLKDEKLRLTEEELFKKAITLRQSAFLESLAFLGEDHPSLSFIKEVIDEFDKSYTSDEVLAWLSKLGSVLRNTLNHEWDVWNKKI
ncbi:membrane protein [Alkalihalobacillus alcalophilus ATCC 27647 = CGMCC 1.3604]|uniref:Membrane protein n=1 Tax=Alkalihalobacillus alcalophilus ATCC 27647 = CGMCC 1.3604 TaxID=1218173 RepID=A0A094WFU4_ALKAL|nr:SEFIR domain-containing protein [Alkalihalobacillus alcalophilus]KGA95646.1 membrane protein [Alkalihalobacillus alcalophilus ATCC 27647 = CGMCC 1.3604]MED1563999.1 TIR domain-containing protein [Alkalihalobacillus alcalophilus]THG92208.1 membrane protein [Alkalihalobacillus alcalophilus ATCC 27647 = CGMCC 1.3604]